MSGICGIVHLDGGPVERPLLEAMTSFLTFRGPDDKGIWSDGQAGFGHTQLRTTFESEREQQPSRREGAWITADARIDGRAELKDRLRTAGRSGVADATDEQLILHAYHVWGTDCVQHLLGDFAFAIWDTARRRLFCARDHLGVKPFFYARMGHCLVFSNTLDCVRRHPLVPSRLNDLFIADFLLFGESQEPDTTAFADVFRLRPAHRMTWSPDEGLRVARYWTLPSDLGVQHRAAGDYVERFRELLDLAVSDRLRTSRVCVAMSGGLDSTSVAAVARDLLIRGGRSFKLNAHAVVYDHLIPDQERYYSGLAAKHLGIPIHYLAADNYQLYERWQEDSTTTPEPSDVSQAAMVADANLKVASLGRVALTGWDGDALLSESLRPRFKSMVRNGQISALARGLLGYASVESKLTRSGWQNWMRRLGPRLRRRQPLAGYPSSLNPVFEAELKLKDRWLDRQAAGLPTHATRPYAYQVLDLIERYAFFESYDAGVTRVPVEYRHPLMDLRLVTYCLALPHQPWVVKKYVLREAMKGLLPESVRRRPKTPLQADPVPSLFRNGKIANLDALSTAVPLHKYVAKAKASRIDTFDGPASTSSPTSTCPLSLNIWLTKLQLQP